MKEASLLGNARARNRAYLASAKSMQVNELVLPTHARRNRTLDLEERPLYYRDHGDSRASFQRVSCGCFTNHVRIVDELARH
jgi:hypothetical protein